MQRVIVEGYGGVENLKLVEEQDPAPQNDEVLVRVTSIGLNHADLMGRRGQYKLSTGEPPFTPGLEAGGVIEAVGPEANTRHVGQRVIIGCDVPRLASGGRGGTYCSHYLAPATKTVLAPDNLPDDQLGAVWLPYLTAWGCLVWKQQIKKGQYIAIPAASSSVALAAAQIARRHGAVPIGMTTSPDKVQRIQALPGCAYEHILVTHDENGMRPWYKQLKQITQGHYADVIFDPVAAGDYLNSEIRCLAQHGTLWVYGLLGQPGPVDVTPLIRKHASVRGWALTELANAGDDALRPGYEHIVDGIASGDYVQHVDRAFRLRDVQQAHAFMEEGKHIGKLVLVP